MRQLSHSVTLQAPSGFVMASLNTYFLERGPHGNANLPLRFPLPNALIGGLTLEKTVSLKLEYSGMEAGGKEIVIAWQPIGTRALPAFTGKLSAIPVGDQTCSLTIEGGYVAPGGFAGSLFDNFVGVRIARATLAALLAQLQGAIEADYSARMRA